MVDHLPQHFKSSNVSSSFFLNNLKGERCRSHHWNWISPFWGFPNSCNPGPRSRVPSERENLAACTGCLRPKCPRTQSKHVKTYVDSSYRFQMLLPHLKFKIYESEVVSIKHSSNGNICYKDCEIFSHSSLYCNPPTSKTPHKKNCWGRAPKIPQTCWVQCPHFWKSDLEWLPYRSNGIGTSRRGRNFLGKSWVVGSFCSLKRAKKRGQKWNIFEETN